LLAVRASLLQHVRAVVLQAEWILHRHYHRHITAIKIFAIIVLVFTTDRLGRRPTVLAMAILCTTMMLLVGILGQLTQTPALKDILILAACLWSFGSAILGSLGWTFVGEVAAHKSGRRTAGSGGRNERHLFGG